MFYLVKTPWWLRRLFPMYRWRIDTDNKEIALSFDDGPDPVATPFVLAELKRYNALATFFCIGSNVVAHPEIYQEILYSGHTVGNHTHNHFNGWRTDNDVYLKDILEASKHIDSSLFRPPYGKITRFQAERLPAVMKGRKVEVVMWDVVSGDFDENISPQKCLEHVIFNTRKGSIVVFHDSEKAFPRLQYVLPKMLEYFTAKGYRFIGM